MTMTTQLVKASVPPKISALTRRKMVLAIALAAIADAIQFAAVLIGGPFGWFFDIGVDVIVMLIMFQLIGFHWLLLPTFALEFIPGVGMIPTWTGCVLWVVRLRHKQQQELKSGYHSVE